MDHPGRPGRPGASDHGPGAGLLGADGEIGDQVEQFVAGLDQAVQPGLLQPQVGQELGPLAVVELGDLLLDGGRNHHPGGALLRGHAGNAIGLGVAGGGRGLVDIADIEHRLGGQKLQAAPVPGVLRRDRDAARRAAVLQRRLGQAQQAVPGLRLPVAAAQAPGEVVEPAFDRLEVGQPQLGLDRGGIGDRVDAALDMGDIVVLEAAQHMGDGIDLADIGQEPVAQSLALRGAAHQPGEIDEGQPGRDGPARAADPGQGLEALVRHRHLADIGLDGAEREVRRRRGGGARERVEERRFAHVGQPDDAASETHLTRHSYLMLPPPGSSPGPVCKVGCVLARSIDGGTSRRCVQARTLLAREPGQQSRKRAFRFGCLHRGRLAAFLPARRAFAFGGPRRRPRRQRHRVHESGRVARRQPARLAPHRIQQRLAPVAVGAGEIVQHVGRHQVLVAGVADADPDPVVVGPEMLVQRAQTVVPGVPAALLEPQLARDQVQLVVEHPDVLRRDLEVAHRLANRLARQVHEGLRLDQQHPVGAKAPLRHPGLELAPPGAEAMRPGDRVEGHEADVVAMVGVTCARISQPDEKLHCGPPDGARILGGNPGMTRPETQAFCLRIASAASLS